MVDKLITENLEENFQKGKKSQVPESATVFGSYFKANSQLTGLEKERIRKNPSLSNKNTNFNAGIDKLKQDGFTTLASSLSRFAPEIRNPLLQSENFYLPTQTTRTGAPNVELNRWFGYYYKYHPLIGNLINLHAELPLSRFGFQGVEDPSILHTYEDMSDDMNLFSGMIDFLKTWFLYGEAQPYLFWDDNLNRFNNMAFLDTSYIEVFSHAFFHNNDGNPTTVYSLIPDDLLVELIYSEHPMIKELVTNNLPESVIQSVNESKPLIINNFNTEMVMRKANPWDIRGTSVVLGCLKELMYEDKLRESQYAIAEGHVNPKWIWKLGQPGEYMPTTDDITAFKDVLIAANNDPIFNLVTHYAVNLQVEGSSGRILPIVPELQFVETRIMSALFSNRSLVTGEGLTYANSSVALRALMSRYIPIRAMAENFFLKKVFLPTALANGFFKRKKADLAHNIRTSVEEIIIPEFNWSHKQNLLDDSNIKNMLVQLRSNTELPMKVITDALDLDYEEVKTFMQREQGTVLDPVARKARETNIQSQVKDPEDTVKGWWKKLTTYMLKYKLPTAEENLEDVHAELPEISKTPVKDTTTPANDTASGDSPSPPSSPGSVGPIPEENADIPEPDTEAPLGASKKFDKALTFNREAAFKEVSNYFDKAGEKYKLNIKKESQFNFLKNSDAVIKTITHTRGNKFLRCPSCGWTQSIFINPKVVKDVRSGNYSKLNLPEGKDTVLRQVVSSLKWFTYADYISDTEKECPKCKAVVVDETRHKEK